MHAKISHEVQVGLSYNRTTWQTTGHLFYPDETFKRNKPAFQPCVRYKLHFNLISKDSLPKLNINVFTGYHIFGGKSISDSSAYKDKYAFHTLELGINPSFYILPKLSVGIAFKMNYTPLVFQKDYGSPYQSDEVAREWKRQNVADRFKKLSYNMGLTASYQYQRFSLSAEAWFGLTNLNNIESLISKIEVKENNYRLLLGYTLGNKKNKK